MAINITNSTEFDGESTYWIDTDTLGLLDPTPLTSSIDDPEFDDADSEDELGIDVDAVEALTLDELDIDPQELETVQDHRTLEDFDFAALVAEYPAFDIDGLLAALEREKLPYMKAVRKADPKKNAASEFYSAANDPIFRRRKDYQQQISELEGKRASKNRNLELARLRRDLEYTTELLVRLNYGMTRTYVRKFTSNTSAEDSADFQGAANVGLMHAISTYDPDKGRFGSWSFKPIQRAVLKAVQQADFSNMSGGDFEKRPVILRAYADLAGPDNERTPTHTEVAERAGVTEALVKRVLNAPHVDSIHAQVGESQDMELGDLIADDEKPLDDAVISSLEVESLLNYGLPILDPRQRYVIVCRYGLHGEPPQALADIGKHLNLSREAVRQIAGKALAHLAHPMVLGALARGGA